MGRTQSGVERVDAAAGTLLRLRGVIDETFGGTTLAGSSGQVLVFDLDEVPHFTSAGLREWLVAIRSVAQSYYCFVKCRPAVVSQFNMVRGLAGQGEVVSLYLPYRCDSCGAAEDVLLDLRREYDVVAAGTAPPRPCPCGALSELDAVPQMYFRHVRGQPAPRPPAAAAALIDGQVQEAAPFDIQIDLGDAVTAFWLSGYIDRSGYFKHLHTGLQGDVLVVLDRVTGASEDGLRGLGELLATVGDRVYLARLPVGLVAPLSRVLASPERLVVVSVRMTQSCTACGGSGVVDLPLAGEAPDRLTVSCADCGRPLTASAGALATSLPVSGKRGPEAVPPRNVLDYLELRPVSVTLNEYRPATSADMLLGKYSLVRSLGSGGMGEVVLARQIGPGGFERNVVLKRIRRDRLGRQSAIDDFVREARLAAQLSHPHIVQVHDFAQMGGEYVLAMEYVKGADLRRVLRLAATAGIQIPLELCCRIGIDLAAALHAAHTHVDELGRPCPILHRDVSPSNLMLSSQGIVKLMDFGIARALESDDGGTEAGIVKGKLRYMAPEVMRGDASRLHPRIDVYSAGVVLHECIATRPLAAAATGAGAYRPVSSGDLRAVRPEIPSMLLEVVQRALDPGEQRRYQSARELESGLGAVLHRLGRPAGEYELAAWLATLCDPGDLLSERSSAGETPPTAITSAGGTTGATRIIEAGET